MSINYSGDSHRIHRYHPNGALLSIRFVKKKCVYKHDKHDVAAFSVYQVLQFFTQPLHGPWSSPPRMLQPCHQLPSCVGRVPGSQMEVMRMSAAVSLIRTTYYTNFWGCTVLESRRYQHDHFHLKSRIWIWYLFKTFVSFRQDSWCSKLSQPQLNRVAACCSDQWYPRQIQILETDKIYTTLDKLTWNPQKNTCSCS